MHSQERHAAKQSSKSGKDGASTSHAKGSGLRRDNMKHTGMLTGTAIGVKPADSEEEVIQSVYTASELPKQTGWLPTGKIGGSTPRKQQAASYHSTGAGGYQVCSLSIRFKLKVFRGITLLLLFLPPMK